MNKNTEFCGPRPGHSILCWAAFLALGSVLGGAAPEPMDAGSAVAVVYNQRFDGSRDLAEYYARRRGVPASQVFGFNLPTTETITRKEFHKQLQTPLIKALERKKLIVFPPKRRPAASPTNQETSPPFVTAARIRYLVLCSGVPVKVLPDPDLTEPGIDSLADALRRNEASVDTELAVLPQFHRTPRLTGPLPNPGYGATNEAQLGPASGLLLVARLDGPDVEVARRLVDQAIAAEQEGLWGRAYLDLRGLTNTAYALGDQWLAGAGTVLHRAGFDTVWDTNATTFAPGFPMSHIAYYAGWYDPALSGPFQVPPLEFMPGAFAYHLHSFSARQVRTRESGWVGPLVDRGATATVGYVEEPYLSATLDLATFTARWVMAGFTYGEAVYAALPVLSWQATVVGDPLYRPFGREPGAQLGHRFRDLHFQLAAKASPLLEWSHLHVVNLGLGGRAEIPSQEIVDYLEQSARELQSAVLMEKLGDVMRAAGRFQPAMTAYRQAVEWGGSRQQRVRMLLELAKTQESLGLKGDALQVYEEWMAEFPDHPARTQVLAQALDLARNLQRSEAVVRLEAAQSAGQD